MTPLLILALLILAVLTLRYVAVCCARPFTACRCRRPGRRPDRLCRRCRGTGLSIRAGRHTYNHLRRLRHTRRH